MEKKKQQEEEDALELRKKKKGVVALLQMWEKLKETRGEAGMLHAAAMWVRRSCFSSGLHGGLSSQHALASVFMEF